jgi:hypothetical protein
MVSSAPDWIGFVMDRAREGRDIRKVADRMEMFRAFRELFAFMPRTPENWSLLQSVAAELGVPKHELDRALAGQAGQAGQASQGGAGPDAPAGEDREPDIDDLLRPFFVLCRNAEDRRRAADMPADWWDHLAGARELQAVMDSDGDDELLPPWLLGPLRRLEAAWAAREGSDMDFEKAAHNLEKAYVLREIRLGERLLGSPEVLADPDAKGRLEARQVRLLERKSALSRRPRGR